MKKQIREAVEYANGLIGHFEDEGDVLSASMIVRLKNLAESVLAVWAKMPQKINHNHGGACGSGNFCPPSYAEAEAYNKAIDACTLAFAGLGLSVEDLINNVELKEEIRKIVTSACASVWKDTINDLSAKGSIERSINYAMRELYIALHKAWEGKVSG